MIIGIIAEEKEDVRVLETFAAKIVNEKAFSVKHFVGHGCGKLKKKCAIWANVLKTRGCELLIVVHDADAPHSTDVHAQLCSLLADCDLSKKLILVPVEELEAWLLADPAAIKKAFRMKRSPTIDSRPETIGSPKEKLRDIVWKESKKRYVNSIHNPLIAKHVAIDRVLKKCPSFAPFPEFLTTNIKTRRKSS